MSASWSSVRATERPGPGDTALVVALIACAEFGWNHLTDRRWIGWMVCLPLWAVVLWRVLRSPAAQRGVSTSPMVWLTAWLAVTVASVAWAARPVQAAPVAAGIMATVLGGCWAASTWGWRTVQRIGAATGITFNVVSLVAWELGYPSTSFSRLIGISKNFSEAGILAALTAVLTVAGFRSRPRLVALGLGSSAAVLFLADARVSAMSAIIGVAVVELSSSRGLRRVVAAAGALAAIGLGVVVLLGHTTLDSAAARSPDAEDLATFTGRDEVWAAGFDEVALRPWFGIGLTDSELFYEQAARDGRVNAPLYHAHDTLLQTALTSGLPSALVLVLASAGYLLARRDAEREPGRDAVMLVIAVVGLTESLLHEATTAMLLVSSACASLTPRRQEPRVGPVREPERLAGTRSA